MGAVEHGITITAKYKYTKMFYKPEGFGEVKHVKFHFLRFWSSCLQEVILYKNDKRQIHCAFDGKIQSNTLEGSNYSQIRACNISYMLEKREYENVKSILDSQQCSAWN